MNKSIEVSNEVVRGCGWRKVGGIYLRSDGAGKDCGRMPIPCATCPCCGHGIRPARGWTWVDADMLLETAPPCKLEGKKHCLECPLNILIEGGIGLAGLIWVGEMHYPTVADFQREADEVGVSRRVQSVPKGFVLGETAVLLAHRRAIVAPLEMGKVVEFTPGIFRIFRPDRIEIVVSGDESDDEIEGYTKRGLTPVKVVREEQEQAGLQI